MPKKLVNPFESAPVKEQPLKPAPVVPGKLTTFIRKNSSDEEKKPEPKPLPKKIDHSALENMLKAQQSQAQVK